MYSTALYEAFRSEVRDDVAPYLWSDTEVYSYMDDAQKMFCRLQGGIADATSPVTRISVAAGDVFAQISPTILKLREARRSTDGRGLELLNFEDLQTNDFGESQGHQLSSAPGPVRALVVGMEDYKLRLLSVPTEPLTIELVVYRMPVNTVTAGGQVLEIAEQHHRYLLNWMKHLAHQKQDAETYDRGRSEMFREEFEGYCDRAKAERERREHKYRTVTYGGY